MTKKNSDYVSKLSNKLSKRLNQASLVVSSLQDSISSDHNVTKASHFTTVPKFENLYTSTFTGGKYSVAQLHNGSLKFADVSPLIDSSDRNVYRCMYVSVNLNYSIANVKLAACYPTQVLYAIVKDDNTVTTCDSKTYLMVECSIGSSREKLNFVALAATKSAYAVVTECGSVFTFGYLVDALQGHKQPLAHHGFQFNHVVNDPVVAGYYEKDEFIETPVKFVAVSGGEHHFAALSSTGEVYCWGRNKFGQCGRKDENIVTFATRVEGLSDVISIHACKHSTAVVTSSREFWIIGRKGFKKSDENNYHIPHRLHLPNNELVVSVATGGSYFIVRSERNLYFYSLGGTLTKTNYDLTEKPFSFQRVPLELMDVYSANNIFSTSRYFGFVGISGSSAITDARMKNTLTELSKGRKSDIQVRFNAGKIYDLHRLILMKRSSVFSDLIKYHKDGVLEINEPVEQEALEIFFDKLVTYIYTGDADLILLQNPLFKKYMPSVDITMQPTLHFSKLQMDLRNSFTTDEQEAKASNCDFKITMAKHNVTFYAHSYILESNSEYFGGVLGSGMKEDVEKEIVFEEESLEAINILLEFIYTSDLGATQYNINPSNCIDVMLIAESYREDVLSQVAELIIYTLLDSENASAVREIAVRFNKSELQLFCDTILRSQSEKNKKKK